MKRLIAILLLALLAVPAGAQTTSVTLPRCSDAVHAAYTTIGPDGAHYPTWHPPIDPSGCAFDHEHGSNPALFLPGVAWQAGSGVWPAFGSSAARMGMSEGHAGFKVYVFRVGQYRVMLLQHQGTANAALAACTRMHTLDVWIWDEQAGRMAVQAAQMADFGQAMANTTHAPICGTVASTGVRQLPVGPQSVGYEPWRADVITGTLDTRLTFNTLNPQTACDTLTCTANLARTDAYGAARGTYRTLTVEWLKLGGVSLLHATCKPYGTDYFYDCSGATWDETPYRRNVLITGAN